MLLLLGFLITNKREERTGKYLGKMLFKSYLVDKGWGQDKDKHIEDKQRKKRSR